jgi:hypothetical protein
VSFEASLLPNLQNPSDADANSGRYDNSGYKQRSTRPCKSPTSLLCRCCLLAFDQLVNERVTALQESLLAAAADEAAVCHADLVKLPGGQHLVKAGLDSSCSSDTTVAAAVKSSVKDKVEHKHKKCMRYAVRDARSEVLRLQQVMPE